jgi:hypothetical protein
VLAATYGRKKSHFITGMERRAPRRKFLIARSDQRCAEACEFWVTRAVVREKRFDRRAVWEFDGVFRVADNLFEAAEEKHLYTRGLGREAHKRIVTCGRVPGHSLRG